MHRLIKELRRREVFRTAGLYVGIAWIAVEVSSVLFDAFEAPDWALQAVIILAIIGLPVYAVAGAALMGTFVTSLAGVFFYQVLAQFHINLSVAADWRLGAIFGIGGILGMYLGARTQKYVPPRLIKAMLCVCVLFVGAKYLLGFFF